MKLMTSKRLRLFLAESSSMSLTSSTFISNELIFNKPGGGEEACSFFQGFIFSLVIFQQTGPVSLNWICTSGSVIFFALLGK